MIPPLLKKRVPRCLVTLGTSYAESCRKAILLMSTDRFIIYFYLVQFMASTLPLVRPTSELFILFKKMLESIVACTYRNTHHQVTACSSAFYTIAIATLQACKQKLTLNCCYFSIHLTIFRHGNVIAWNSLQSPTVDPLYLTQKWTAAGFQSQKSLIFHSLTKVWFQTLGWWIWLLEFCTKLPASSLPVHLCIWNVVHGVPLQAPLHVNTVHNNHLSASLVSLASVQFPLRSLTVLHPALPLGFSFLALTDTYILKSLFRLLSMLSFWYCICGRLVLLASVHRFHYILWLPFTHVCH